MPEKYFNDKDKYIKLPIALEKLPKDIKGGYMIFGRKEFEGKEDEYKNYKVMTPEGEKALEHRYYACYDLKNAENKSLVFIMFNPSKANPQKLDDTIKNCLKLAKKGKYNRVEILNLCSYRKSKVTSECLNDKDTNTNFIEHFIDKYKGAHYVLAWGYGKEKNKAFKDLIDGVKKKIRKAKIENVFTIGVNKAEINKINHHPAPTAWRGMGEFKKIAILEPINGV